MATSLMKSISDGNAKRLTKLLRHGAGLKLTKDDMSASLFVAIKQSREECVASLLSAGTDANSSDTDGKPAIFLVMEYGRGNPVILKSLLQAGANPDKVTYNTQQTALHAAARKGYQVCVKALLLAGGQMDKADGHGNTALMYAAREGHVTILRTMLQEGADPNKRNANGETPLHLAVKGNHTLCIDELLCQAASTDICDNKGQNALLLAVKMENHAVIDLLLDNKCSVNAQDTSTGKTVLHWAIQSGSVALVTKLLQLNADPNVRDKDWQTPFLLALNLDRKDILEHLFRAGCNISVTDRSFNTALHIASINGQSRIVPLLISKGIAVDLKGSGGMTPLMLAAFGGHVETVYTLLQYGANSSLTDRNHASALVYAILSKAEPDKIYDIIKALIRSNCDVNYAANLMKVTKTFSIELADGVQVEERLYAPVEMAFLKGDPAVFMMLLRSGCDASKFHCDKDSTLRNFKSFHSDLKNRWILLRCINKERKRLKPLKELCRRPVLQTFKGNVEGTIYALPVSEKLKGFLNFSDLDVVCKRYTPERNDYVHTQTSPTNTSPSKDIYSTGSLNRNRLRSTIHTGHYRERTPKSPTTPVLPRATWDDGIKLSSNKTPRPRKHRTRSFSELPMTEKAESRTMSTSDVPPSPEIVSPTALLSPVDQDASLESKTKSIFDFLKISKPKNKDSGRKSTKARSKKAKDPRDTLSALLHGTSKEYRTSGEITPKPLDIEAIEKLNLPKDDYESVNKMLYGNKYSPPIVTTNNFNERVKSKRANVTNMVNSVGVENYINSEDKNNHVGPYRSNGHPSEEIPDECFQYGDHNNDANLEEINNMPLSPNNGVSSRKKHKNKQLELNSLLYGNGVDGKSPVDQTSDYGSNYFNPNDNRKVRRSRSFTGHTPSSKSSVSSDSQFSANSYEDSEHSLQIDIANLAKNISSTFTDSGKASPMMPRSKKGMHKNSYITSNNVPSIKLSYPANESSPLSPTSTTSKSSFESSSSAGQYQFPTGDAQLLHKYLHSQSPEYMKAQNQNHTNCIKQTDNTRRPNTLDIYTTSVGDYNGNHVDDTMSQSSIYSYPSCDSRNEPGKKQRTSSVSSLSSTGSRTPSKIPVLQQLWSPQPVRSKIPVPTSPVVSPASSSSYGRFFRSKSFRK